MAQITVRLSEAQSGIKGGISIGTGRSNQESALAVAAAAIERSHGSVDMGALREAISEQNVGAPETNQEALEEFEEALDLGISAEIFNSAINTKALIKAAQDKWVNQGAPVTAADVQEIDAPIKEVQRAAAMTDYNRMTNRDPSQTVAELAPDSPTLFGIGKDTQISDLTDKQLGDLVKQGLGGQGITDSLFWSARNEQNRRGTTVSTNQFTGALESTPLSEDEKGEFVEGENLVYRGKPSGDEGFVKYEGSGDSFNINAPKGDTPYTLFLRKLLGMDASGWASDPTGAAAINAMMPIARDYILTNPDYGADENTRRAQAADDTNAIGAIRDALGDIRTLSGFEGFSIGQYMNANPDMFSQLQPSGSDLTGYDFDPMASTPTPAVTPTPAITPNIPDPSGLGFLGGVMSPENLNALGLNVESFASQVPFQTAWRQQAAATPGSMNPLVSSALAAQSPFAKLQYELSGSGGSPRSFLQNYDPWSAEEFEAGLASVMESAAGFDLGKLQTGNLTVEDVQAANWAKWLAQPENMLSAVETPTLMRTDPFKRDMMQSAFQRLYDIAASRDPAGGRNVDIASLFGGLR